MLLILDIREKSLIESCANLIKSNDIFKNIKYATENLDLGDIIIRDISVNKDIIIYERKAVSDLIASIKDARYREQSYRLTGSEHHNHNIIYIIEGSLKNLTREKQMVYSSIFSLNYYKGFSVYKSENIQETAYMLLNTILKLEKEKKSPYYSKLNSESKEENESKEEEIKYCSLVKKKKSDNITPDNFGEIVLCQIPSVSSTTAVAIMNEYKTLNNLIYKLKEDSKCLDNIKYKTPSNQLRKISKLCIENIVKFLLNDVTSDNTSDNS